MKKYVSLINIIFE